MNTRRPRLAPVVAIAGLMLACAPADESDSDSNDSTIDLAAIDGVFSDFSGEDGPGCAIAVSQDGQTTLTRAYGMANLEYDVANSGETVFEPGSVSKQFTAAATIMMSLDGLIDLDDDVREYFPELPDYGEPITIRNLIHHTSGLRDWGSIAGIEGWGRTTRIHTHKHVVDIAARQEALNYPPGEHYSYTNTGYNLQAVLVERVTGKTFDEYSQEKIFGPLGMTKTQWRDDFTEIVEDRSVGYVQRDGEWHMLMPFENVHGNGGLLTTVSDLLKFTHNLDTGEVGGQAFIDAMHRQGVLDSGREIEYAGGLFIQDYKGLEQIAHSGGTAAYRGYLTRYPEHGLAVSVMCNAGNANAGGLAHEIVDMYLADAIVEPEEAEEGGGVEVPAATLESYAGGYRDPLQNSFYRFAVEDGGLQLSGLGGQAAPLTAVSQTRFEHPVGIAVEFEAGDGGRPVPLFETPVNSPVRLVPVEEHTPSEAELAQYVGEYFSHEAEVTYTVAVEDGALQLVDRYGDGRPLRPAYRDGFSGPGGMIIFSRDASGSVNGLSMSQGRVWDLRFTKTD
ncbi:MAG: beta-lactamase family protein [Gemmatimonadota bacterium]|nr:beta-lactamase family protein [Gemmatimonadota bacterium]